MRSSLALIALIFLAAAAAAPAADGGADAKLPATRVRDLHYGDVLFHFFQDDRFEAVTRLNAYTQWNRMPSHATESQLLLGGLYLSLGLHNEAGALFEKLLTPDVPAAVRDRAWFFLAKVWYARGYLDRAEQALRSVQGVLPAALQAEKQHLLANVLMRLERFDEAAQLLEGWKGPADWMAYAQFNLGVALVRLERLEEADQMLTAVGTLETQSPELLALKDRANLALGYAYLQTEQPIPARAALERVRLNGPYSNKALLGTGWADASVGAYRRALTPWMELHGRNLLDAAVQESYLAVPHAFARLNANAQAAEYYESAIRAYEEENRRLDAAIGRIRDGNLLEALLEREEDERAGWFWQLENLPDAPESRYLYVAFAGHDFQEGLKNYRDLAFLGRTLERWSGSMAAFTDMIEARDRAHAQRLPRVDTLLAAESAERAQRERREIEARLDAIEAQHDAAALGSPEEREQWTRVERLEAALEAAPDDADTNEARDRLRLVKGVLQYRLEEAFKERLWQERRALRSLDGALREAQSRTIRVSRARETASDYTELYAARITDLERRMSELQGRLARAAQAQSDHLERLAIGELEAQKERLATYLLQARFALANIYDRAASPQDRTSIDSPQIEGPVAPPGAPAPEAPSEKPRPRLPEEPRL